MEEREREAYPDEYRHCSSSRDWIVEHICIDSSNHRDGTTGVDSSDESEDQERWVVGS